MNSQELPDGTNHPALVYLWRSDDMHVLTAIDKQNISPASGSSSVLHVVYALYSIFHKPWGDLSNRDQEGNPDSAAWPGSGTPSVRLASLVMWGHQPPTLGTVVRNTHF